MANVPPQGGRKHPHQEFLQVDTSNILFICGGAFDGLEEIIAERTRVKPQLGFGGGLGEGRMHSEGLLRQVAAEDLLRFGMIPEFVGRLPVTITVDALSEDDMVRILTEPKNALVRQYRCCRSTMSPVHARGAAGRRPRGAAPQDGRPRTAQHHRRGAARRDVRCPTARHHARVDVTPSVTGTPA